MAETADDNSTWCVHIQGPDDVLPARSRREAILQANAFNASIVVMIDRHDEEGFYPTCWAVPGKRSDVMGR